MSIGLGVDWAIEKGKSLVIDSPKYIGYQVGFMDPDRDGRIGWLASTASGGDFDYNPVQDVVPVPLATSTPMNDSSSSNNNSRSNRSNNSQRSNNDDLNMGRGR